MASPTFQSPAERGQDHRQSFTSSLHLPVNASSEDEGFSVVNRSDASESDGMGTRNTAIDEALTLKGPETDAAGLHSKVTMLKGEIDYLRSKIQLLETREINTYAVISSLQGAVDKLVEANSVVEGKIKTLERPTELEVEHVRSMKEAIRTTEEEIDFLREESSKHKSRISKVEGGNDSLNKEISLVKAGVANYDKDRFDFKEKFLAEVHNVRRQCSRVEESVRVTQQELGKMRLEAGVTYR